MRVLLLLTTALLVPGCGNLIGANRSTTTASTTSTSSGSLSVTAFSPASSTLSATPTTVVVYFSESNLNSGSATTASNYTLTCNSSSTAATSASYVYGTNYVTVTLPAISANSGDTCSMFVSLNVNDTNGAIISGNREVDYFMNASTSAFSWSEAASVTYTSAVGGSGGSAYNDAGADGLALSGLNLNVNSLIMGVNGAWSNSAGTVSYGGVHGTSPTATSLTCPAGYRVTGVFGYYSTYVEGIGIYCKNSTQSLSYTSSMMGTASGSSFSISCNSGQFATSLYGNAGAYVDSLGIGCR